jgi:hypothetical protein
VKESPGSFLHRFQWLADDQIGELPPEWNALALEQDLSDASLIHYTCGTPAMPHYRNCDGAENFHRAYKRMTHIETE